MNKVVIRGREFSKVELFDYTFDTFVEADWTEPGSVLWEEYDLLRKILRSYGWLDEYHQWVADGAGASEAAEELRRILKANPVAW